MKCPHTIFNNCPVDRSISLLSHDLRAALTDVVGGLQLVDVSTLSGANKSQMDRVLASSEALVALMDELTINLENSAATVDDTTYQVDLKKFLESAARRWIGVAKQQNMKFELKMSSDMPTEVALSRGTLERVLSNVLENSFKYADVGAVVLFARLGPNQELVFEVSDNGPGFGRDAMEALFSFGGRPVASTKPGTGFGLNAVKRILDSLGAEIDVKNQETGASVTMSIPKSAWQPGRQRAGSVASQLKSNHLLTGLKFLLAEDNRTSQLVALNMLERLGAQVTVVEDGFQALEEIEAHDFDVVLLDIEMPNKSGTEVITEVRARKDRKSRLPLIALTAFVMGQHRTNIMSAGADGTISKPVTNTDELGRAINTILSGLPWHHDLNSNVGHDDGSAQFIDVETYFSLCGSVGVDAFYKILKIMVIDLSEVHRSINLANEQQDLLELLRASHVLISISGAIGANRLLSSAQKLNMYANNGDLDKVSAMSKACSKDLTLLISFVEKQSTVA